MTNSNISKFNRLVMGVAVAALIAASCGTDEPEVVQPPAETTTTVAEQPTTTVQEAVADTGTDSSPGEDEALVTTTTAALEASEPEPEPVQTAAPSLVVDPDTVSVGLTTFTIEGAGFDPSLTTWTLLCPLDPNLSEDSPEEELVAAMGAVSEADCDLATAQGADIADDGTFSVQRDVIVNPQNFMVVASDADQTQVAAAAVFVSTEEPEQVTTAVPSATEPVEDEPEPEDEPTPTTSTPPDASVDPEVVEPEPEPPTTTTPQPEPEPEPEPEPTVTTAPPEPEPEPEPVQEISTTLVVSPDVVPEGRHTFTIEGSGYDPSLATWTLLCALDSSLTEDTPTEQIEAAVAAVESADCDLTTAEPVDINPDGTFTDTRDAIVRGNFVWVASDIAETQTAAAAVILSQWPHGPPGTIVYALDIWPDNEDYPPNYVCEINSEGHVLGSDGSSNCWLTSVPVTEITDDEIANAKVGNWFTSCSQRETGAMRQSAESCEVLLKAMSPALDYLGANTECVLDAYTQRVDYWVTEGSDGSSWTASNNYGWHRCATVIDPIDEDSGLKLSDTIDMTVEGLAERCRIVLVGPMPDIELEDIDFDGPIPFGQDCDGWAAEITTRNLWRFSPDCAGSLFLAGEWMEHRGIQLTEITC